MDSDRFGSFDAWSLTHCLVILVALMVSVTLGTLRRRRRDQASGRQLDAAIAAFAVALWIFTQIVQVASPDFPPRTALPLHVSDLAALAVPVAVWTCSRWARCIVYYWGLTLGTLAFILPDLRDGPAKLGFWLFWLTHTVILLGVLYDIIGRDFRPGWRDFTRAASASLVYAVVIVALNAATGYSYGYLGPEHSEEPAALGYFGQWPLRVVPIVVTGLTGMVLLTVPWTARVPIAGAKVSDVRARGLGEHGQWLRPNAVHPDDEVRNGGS